jgi:predicted 3-demethylubiquinone-9 3-methyltransferase (glyoxalase superfamily)
MQKITTFLWFDDKAEEAAKFYTSLLPRLLRDKDSRKSRAAMKAMLQMKKLDIPTLKRAADQA